MVRRFVHWAKLFCGLLLLFVLLFSNASPSRSEVPCGGCDGLEPYIDVLNYISGELQRAEGNLMQLEQSEWSNADIEQYLTYALATVYYVYQIEVISQDYSQQISLEQLPASQYASVWPDNPYNNWEPIVVRDNPIDYFPGDIIREVCPPFDETYPEMSLSFELYIMGPDPDWATTSVEPMTGNKMWAQPPAGAVVSLGVHVESGEEREARMEAQRRMLEMSERAEETHG